MKIQQIPIAEIKPYKNNPRNHGKAIKMLMESIKRYGFTVPLVLDKKKVIVAGHGRYEAAQKLGLETLPCIVKDLPAKKIREYRLVDNKVAEFSSWDMEAYQQEMREIAGLIGSEVEEIEEIFADIKKFTQDYSGNNIQDMEDGKVKSTRRDMRSQIRERSKVPEKISVICEHCGGKFFIEKRSL